MTDDDRACSGVAHDWQMADSGCELGCDHRRLYCDECALTVDVDQQGWSYLTPTWKVLDDARRAFIDPSQVRVGDRVRLSCEGVVTAHDLQEQTFTLGKPPGDFWIRSYADMNVALLDRPLHPIPTADGTVIQHRGDVHRVAVRAPSPFRPGELAWRGFEPGWVPDPADWHVLVVKDGE